MIRYARETVKTWLFAGERGERMTGHIRRRGANSWAIVIDTGRDPNGKRQQRWHSVKGTRKDAERERTRLLSQLDTGSYVEPTRMKVSQYLEKWLDDAARVNVSAKTLERYTEIVELHLVPALGQLGITKLAPLHIQSYYTKALREGRIKSDGGLSPQTVLHHHRVLHEALEQAVKWLILTRNPADAVEPPRPSRKEMAVLNDDDVGRLINLCRDTRLFVPTLLAVTTGLRRGELLSLKWSDVDLGAGVVTVQRSLEQTREGLAFKAPKTNKSRRVVTLPAFTVDALTEHRRAQREQRVAITGTYELDGLVCAMPDGGLWNPNSFSSAFKDFARRQGFGHIRFHDLRHTHATQLLRQGIHPKIVSERLGHSAIGITLDTYSHVLPGMQEDAARRLDAALKIALAAVE